MDTILDAQITRLREFTQARERMSRKTKQSNQIEELAEDPELSFAFGVRLEFGWGTKSDLRAALALYQQDELTNNKAALYRIWKVILKLHTTDDELKRVAAVSLKKSAALGHASAMFDLYLYGPRFLGLSTAIAGKWLTRAAAVNYKAAMLALATDLLKPEKPSRASQVSAERLLKELVEDNDAQAKYLLASLWLKRDQKSGRALSLMNEAAAANYPAANSFLSWAYHDGTHGLKKDLRKSKAYRRKTEKATSSLLSGLAGLE